MVKLIGLLKRKPGMSRQEFRDYYEKKHAPLARSLALGTGDYRRNYPNVVRIEGKEVEGDPEFDAITEMWFNEREDYDTFSRAMQDPATRLRIVQDEECFIDRSSTVVMLVEEHCSPAAQRDERA